MNLSFLLLRLQGKTNALGTLKRVLRVEMSSIVTICKGFLGTYLSEEHIDKPLHETVKL